MRHLVGLAFVGLLSVPTLSAAVCASVTTCTFNLDSTAVAAFGSAPYGTVKLDLVGSTIKFTIDLADGLGFNLIDTGAHHAFTFNGATGITTVSAASFSTDVPTLTGLYFQNTGAGPFAQSGYRSFDYAIDSTCRNGSGCGINALTFTVSRTGGFADVNQLVDLSATSGGAAAYFAADIANTAGATGLVAALGPPISAVPEANYYSVPLTGGLGFLVFMAHRCRRQNESTAQ